MNHLFVGKNSSGTRNRLVAEGPRIVSTFPMNTHFTKHLQALDRASSKLSKERANNSKPVKSNTSVKALQVAEEEESKSHDTARSQEVQDSVESVESQDKVGTTMSQDNTVLTVLQDNARQTESRVGSATEHVQVDVNQRELQDTLRSGESQNTVGSKELENCVDSKEGERLLDIQYQNVEEDGVQTCASLHVTIMQEENSVCVEVGAVDGSVLCNTSENKLCSEHTGSSEYNTVDHQCQHSIVSNQHKDDSISGGSAIQFKSDSSLLTMSVENIPSLEESDSAILNSHSEGSEEMTNKETKVSNISSDTVRISLECDHAYSPRWTTMSTNSSQTESHMVTKFVYIASKQYNNHNTSSSSSSASSAVTSPTSPLMTSTPLMTSSPVKTNKPFFPFPVKHVNRNRAKNGLKLGLYNSSTVEIAEAAKQKQGNGFFKTRNSLS